MSDIDPDALADQVAALHRTPRKSGGSVNLQPTEAQKAAGNYAKQHVRFQGLDISIENKRGSTRSGTSGNGRSWSCVLPADYGYIKRTEGADGDHVDVYVGPNHSSRLVFIINQKHLHSGRFYEHKAMLGFNSEREAVETYCKAFSDGRGRARLGGIETVSMDAFRNWLKGDTTKPASAPSIIEKALHLVKRG